MRVGRVVAILPPHYLSLYDWLHLLFPLVYFLYISAETSAGLVGKTDQTATPNYLL